MYLKSILIDKIEQSHNKINYLKSRVIKPLQRSVNTETNKGMIETEE